MPKGIFFVSYDLLKEVLCLPNDVKILAITGEDPDIPKGAFAIKVSHPDIPEHEEGKDMPILRLAFRRQDGIIEFLGWDE